MRLKFAAGNWKMNKTLEEGQNLIEEIVSKLKVKPLKEEVRMVIGVPFPYLSSYAALVSSQTVALAAQNCYPKASGAYTGEVSVPMLKSAGVEYVIIGHSERRQYFNESNKFIAEKVDAILTENLIPIFCCGESLELHESGEHFNFVKNQIKESLFHLDAAAVKKVVIAYEPIWAIGTGKTATSEQAQEMHKELRAFIAGKYGLDVADEISILYGGSVNAGNAKELFGMADVDGGLVGGASLKADDFVSIAHSF